MPPKPALPPALGDLDVERHLDDPALKQAFVTPMFDLIAPRYDRFTRLFSFGMDATWKADLLAEAAAVLSGQPTPVVVDLACGTGDLAFGMSAQHPRARVLGFDASPRMIDGARERARREATRGRVQFEVADAAAVPLPSASVDLITVGYGYRNVPDAELALREAARLLRPGGVLLTLDFLRPAIPVWRELFLGYLRVAGDVVGWWWHREPVVYGYIARSIARWHTAASWRAALARAGFVMETERLRLLGGLGIHRARWLDGDQRDRADDQ